MHCGSQARDVIVTRPELFTSSDGQPGNLELVCFKSDPQECRTSAGWVGGLSNCIQLLIREKSFSVPSNRIFSNLQQLDTVTGAFHPERQAKHPGRMVSQKDLTILKYSTLNKWLTYPFKKMKTSFLMVLKPLIIEQIATS